MKTTKIEAANSSGIPQKNLALAIIAVTAIVAIRLAIAAEETNNWKGFYFSMFQVVVVGAASFVALRKR